MSGIRFIKEALDEKDAEIARLRAALERAIDWFEFTATKDNDHHARAKDLRKALPNEQTTNKEFCLGAFSKPPKRDK